MLKKITIIDYGAGNILSVRRAFEYCSANVEITSSANKIKNSSYLVLPGDGSFKFASIKLRENGIFDAIKEHCLKEKPLLGICLGMQILMTQSEEFGKNKGLNLIKGDVLKIKKQIKKFLKTPVIGQQDIYINQTKHNMNLIKKYKLTKKNYYFIHSYQVVPKNKNEIIAYYKYGNQKITAIIAKQNIIGTQFHPEKSGKDGINLIKTFLKTN